LALCDINLHLFKLSQNELVLWFKGSKPCKVSFRSFDAIMFDEPSWPGRVSFDQKTGDGSATYVSGQMKTPQRKMNSGTN
jgi:hypothetical protein